jgi:hypothetical protein
MHPDTMLRLVKIHQDELIAEAEKARKVGAAKSRAQGPVSASGSVPAWRRVLGWAAIDLGVRLSGGPIGPTSETR